MNNADMPAMPVMDEVESYGQHYGLTKREHFAALSMQALLSKHGGHEGDMSSPCAIRSFSEEAPDIHTVAKYSCNMADALLAELEARHE